MARDRSFPSALLVLTVATLTTPCLHVLCQPARQSQYSVLDTNGDGSVSAAEMNAAMDADGDGTITTAEANAADADGDGRISLKEAADLVTKPKKVADEAEPVEDGEAPASAASEEFSPLDTNRDRKISGPEINAAIDTDGDGDVSHEEGKAADSNGDGVISADEAEAMLGQQEQAAPAAPSASVLEILDTNDDGQVTHNEINDAIDTDGDGTVSHEEGVAADSNGDGVISAGEAAVAKGGQAETGNHIDVPETAPEPSGQSHEHEADSHLVDATEAEIASLDLNGDSNISPEEMNAAIDTNNDGRIDSVEAKNADKNGDSLVSLAEACAAAKAKSQGNQEEDRKEVDHGDENPLGDLAVLDTNYDGKICGKEITAACDQNGDNKLSHAEGINADANADGKISPSEALAVKLAKDDASDEYD